MNHTTMKNLPLGDRPYERCIRLGTEGLSDAELLAIIIRTGSRHENSLVLAQKILALNYPQEGILGLLHLSLSELMQVSGIGKVKSIQLLCIGELSKRIWRQESLRELVSFHEPIAIVNYYMEELRHMEQEQVKVMFLNTKQVLIRDILLSKGTVNASLVSPREIFIEALRYKAVNIILVHNHPSGDPTPSCNDKQLTKSVKDAGQLIGIQLIDHVIIGDASYVSFKERGLL